MDISRIAQDNLKALSKNAYPGRGIVMGLTPDAARFVQVYWIMGRSENSRNRVFVRDGDVVRTAPYDASKVKDPSLIIYNVARPLGRKHIVSNGDQTDTIFDTLRGGGTFEEALFTRTFEPDAPNYTARISGLTDLDDPQQAYKLSVIKAPGGNPAHCTRQFFSYEGGIAGYGHCVTTYAGDGSPLPAFEGEPRLLPIGEEPAAVAETYWTALDGDNKISLLVKSIDRTTGRCELHIVNKHQ
ncbi:MAG: inosine monophosphate cyclohydrolase [Candidatus Brocadiaceae bacterium]|nr:inosine monophosphate cyclohydrolase [Candidatus Brocadiaceae bacterium]